MKTARNGYDGENLALTDPTFLGEFSYPVSDLLIPRWLESQEIKQRNLSFGLHFIF